MRFFKNIKYRILIKLDYDGRRSVFNNGIQFAAPEWYRPAYDPIEEITEGEYRTIKASGNWEQVTPARNDAAFYNYWD